MGGGDLKDMPKGSKLERTERPRGGLPGKARALWKTPLLKRNHLLRERGRRGRKAGGQKDDEYPVAQALTPS